MSEERPVQDSEEEYKRKVASYGIGTLQEVLASIDREKHPGRYAIAEAELAGRNSDTPDTDQAGNGAGARVAGIGGWLILPLIGLILSPFLWGYIFVVYLGVALNSQVSAVFGSPSSPHYFPGWPFFVSFVTVSSLFLMAFKAWVLADFLRKKRRTRTLLILALCGNIAFTLGFYLFIRQAPPALQAVAGKAVLGLVQSLIAAGIWIPYFLKSERVANTFVK
jgi:hypothetical protein